MEKDPAKVSEFNFAQNLKVSQLKAVRIGKFGKSESDKMKLLQLTFLDYEIHVYDIFPNSDTFRF